MKTVAFVLFVILILSGCSVKNVLTPEAEKVRLYDSLPTDMKCEYKDEIIGSEANMMTYLFISNREITEGARADLRNQAVQIGGNSVLIQRADFVYATSTVFIGQVYDCSPKQIK